MRRAMQLAPRPPAPLQPPPIRQHPGEFPVARAEAIEGRPLPARVRGAFAPPIHRQRASQAAATLATHLGYGVLTALAALGRASAAPDRRASNGRCV
jgi:hypothetical protein